MLRDARIYHDLPLRAIAYASRIPGDSKLKIVAIGDALDRDVPLTGAAMALVDSAGRLSSQWTARPDELKGTHLMAALVAPPGSYRLRVAAIDVNGRRGSVDYEFDAALQRAGTLQLSGVVLGVSPGGAFTPKLVFTTDSSATAFLEVYGDAEKAMGVSIKLEIANSPDGPALAVATVPSEQAFDGDRRMAVGAIPLGALEPGDYIVRAVVTSDGKPLGTVYRTLRKRDR